jgi:uncharacterized membrane-anchored protein YhcB (DUF1043 family)
VTDTIPPELIGLVISSLAAVGLLVALIIYVYVARQSKRRGQRPSAVIKADLETIKEKGRAYRQLGEVVQKAASKTVETLSTTLASAEDKLTSTQTQPGQNLLSSSSDQGVLRQRPSELAPSPLPPTPSRVLEKPVLGMPGRMLDPLNFVDDIDQLVQRRLRERPDLAGRHIRLATGLDGGLRIYVNDQTFEAIGDIADFKIRELIRDAIREWEGV